MTNVINLMDETNDMNDMNKMNDMDKMQIFEHEEFGQVRTIEENGRVLFCGLDVAKALAYDQPRKAIARHCRYGTKRTVPHPQNPDKQIEMSFIPEGDVYRLIARSKLPAAERFERWVFDEVLPSIRKTGGYIPINSEDTDLEIVSRALLIVKKSLDQKNEIIEQQRPKVLFAEAVETAVNSIPVGDIAKILEQNGVKIGRNRLFAWLREIKLLMKQKGNDWNMPTQYAMEHGWFEIRETTIVRKDGSTFVQRTPLVTGKGQIFLVNKYLSEHQKNLKNAAN